MYDPGQQTGGEPLRVYALERGQLVRTDETWFDDIGLGVTLWRGSYQGCGDTWLRWCDRDGAVILTGEERAVVIATAYIETMHHLARNYTSSHGKPRRAECIHNGSRTLGGQRQCRRPPSRGKVILSQARSPQKDASTLSATDERPFYKRPLAQAAHRMQPP